MKKTLLGLTIVLGGVLMSAQTYNSVAEFSSPPSLSLGYLGNATTILQQRYNRNVQRMQVAVDDISRQIARYEDSYILAERINGNCIDQLSVNYTNDSNVSSWINWLYKCANAQINR